MTRPSVQTVYRSQLKKMWCPHGNKFNGRGTRHHCLGQKCMAFVTTYQEKRKVDGGDEEPSYGGYCGETFGFIGTEWGEQK